MIHTSQLTANIKEYLMYLIGEMAKAHPLVGFVRPLVSRALNKNIGKIDNLVSMIADENGNIDIEEILTEMINSVVTGESFTIDTLFIGPISIGGGVVKMNIPLTDKELVLNRSDLETLKTIITKKN